MAAAGFAAVGVVTAAGGVVDLEAEGVVAVGLAALGAEATGVEVAGVDAVGVEVVDVDAAGVEAAGVEAAGVDAAEVDAAEVEAAGVDAAEVEAAGVDAAGLSVAGAVTEGPSAAGTAKAGGGATGMSVDDGRGAGLSAAGVVVSGAVWALAGMLGPQPRLSSKAAQRPCLRRFTGGRVQARLPCFFCLIILASSVDLVELAGKPELHACSPSLLSSPLAAGWDRLVVGGHCRGPKRFLKLSFSTVYPTWT
jgi:hypothetical protein